MSKKIIEKHSKSADSLKYSGDISLKILDGDRVLSEQKYHNHGCQKLFNFITDCLTGNFAAAKSSRPCRIVLFEMGSHEEKGVFNARYWNDDTKVSTKVFYDSAVVPGSSNSSTITYHFRIPFLCLVSGAQVAKVGLYPDVITSLSNDICAYYYLDTPFEVPDHGGNFTVVIDWKLTIQNA